MRIGLFSDTYTPDINGVVSSIVTLQQELEKNGHEVFIITNYKAFLSIQKEGNILRIPGLELKWLYGYKLSTPYHFHAKDEIKRMHLDVIHVHTEFGVGLFGRIVGRYLNIPVVSTYHTMYEDYTHYINRFDIDEIEALGKKIVTATSRMLSDHVQAVIAPSEKTKATLLKYGVSTPISVIPTGLHLQKFQDAKKNTQKLMMLRTQYGILEEEKVIVFVGRIAKEKSIEIPIEGFRYLQNKTIKLCIVGDGPQLEELKQLVESYELQQQVIFTGSKNREEIPYFYALADAFVSASLTETQGMTYIEALASSLPVFARYDDVLKDLIEDGKNGYFFESPQEFIQKIESYFEQAPKQRQMHQEFAKDSVSKYDSNVFYQNVFEVYQQAIQQFEHAFEVIKIKAHDEYMSIYVQNDKEHTPLKIRIHLDDYFQLKIQKHMLLERTLVQELQSKEKKLNAYRLCIRKLKRKDYTSYEIKEYIKKQMDLESEEIEDLIQILIFKGYINDEQYMLDKIESLQYSLQGKTKIIKTLTKKGLPYEQVKEAVSKIDDLQESVKAMKVAKKLAYSMKDKSKHMKRKLIAQKLVIHGFEQGIAKETSEALDLQEHDDAFALEKTFHKALRLYKNKYKNEELRYKIIQYCMQKGFEKSSIYRKLEEMEWDNENDC